MNKFKELKVWKKAVEMTVKTYKATATFPSKEQFGITSQINRSAVSIPANIAEGAGRNTKKDFNHFLGIALGSSCELETLLFISFQLNYLNEDKLNELTTDIEEIQRMIYSLQNANNQ